MTHDDFRDARIKLHLSQLRCAVQLGVSLATVKNWETGTHRIPKMAAIVMDQWLEKWEKAR